MIKVTWEGIVGIGDRAGRVLQVQKSIGKNGVGSCASRVWVVDGVGKDEPQELIDRHDQGPCVQGSRILTSSWAQCLI